jgi:hypothetical protein
MVRISIGPLREIVMISGMKRCAATLTSITLASAPALASQGPGTVAGTAGSTTQLAMAILVYGACALVVGFGLIGALRK